VRSGPRKNNQEQTKKKFIMVSNEKKWIVITPFNAE
jgi:hypothetical protein